MRFHRLGKRKCCALFKHGFKEDMELVAVLVPNPVHPQVIAVAVLQTGQDDLLGLVEDGQRSGQPKAGVAS